MTFHPNWQNKDTDYLVDNLLNLRTKDEVYRVLDDLCTINEIKSLAQRMQIVQLLHDKMVYNDIAQTTGASTATISRVNRCLHYGSGGYTLLLERMKEAEDTGE
jgi:TrpR-related protein YerC/YecD